MKIIIDITEEQYEIIKELVKNQNRVCPEADSAEKIILKGTPLSKGHGRLIDADELIQDIKDDSQLCYFNSWSEKIIHDNMVDFAIDRITDAHIIVEAESEEENADSN